MKSLNTARRTAGLALTAALTLTLTIGVPAPAQAWGASTKCGANVVFIGVRGTGSPAGTGSAETGLVYASGGFGAEIEPLRAMLVNGEGPTVWARGLAYAADGPTYTQSMTYGATKLVDLLNTIPSCAVRPLVHLAGHSQGADVVLSALASPNLTVAARNSIKAVAVYGDPAFKPGMNYNAPGSPTVRSGTLSLTRPASAHTALQTKYWFWGWPQGSSQTAYSSRIRSYCFTNDWACQNLANNASTNATHNSYDTKTRAVFDWFIYMQQWT